jgi:hypothetical protein
MCVYVFLKYLTVCERSVRLKSRRSFFCAGSYGGGSRGGGGDGGN